MSTGPQSYGPPGSASIIKAGTSAAPHSSIPDHGGGLDAAESRFGRPAGGWIDLSTGINPWPWPMPEISLDAWTRLPDHSAHNRLIQAAAAYFGAPRSAIIAAPGSQALIQAIPRLVRRGRVAILGFTYAEHARCWRLAGHEVTVCDTLESAVASADCVIVTNPNNPDGRQTAPAELLATADHLAHHNGLLVVDEAFADVTPTLSVAPAGRPGLCVLRSFGKFFGLAGLRLGFALAPQDLTERLTDHLGPWAVAGPALEIGAAALADESWITASRASLATASRALDSLLESHGLAVIGGTDLFRLAQTDHAAALYEHLGRHGILVRPFEARDRWLRFGLPPDATAAARLRSALGSFTLQP